MNATAQHEAEARAILIRAGLPGDRAVLRALAGGYLNQVWRVDLPDRRLVLKRFSQAATGTLFPNLPEDEARALQRLSGLEVAPTPPLSARTTAR